MNNQPHHTHDDRFTDHDAIEQQLRADADLAVPTSLAPDISDLQSRVYAVRRNRKMARVANATLAACLVAACGFVMFDRFGAKDHSPGEPSPSQIAVELPVQNDILQEPQRPNMPSHNAPRIQLYARYVEPMPVFDIDQEKQEVHHVGWVESERNIPVDMKYVPTDQQETFNAMLSGDTWNISL